jgi:hypothetical protein
MNSLSDAISRHHVEVQMLGVLVSTQVGDDTASTLPFEHLSRHATHGIHQPEQRALRRVAEVDERRNMLLGNDHDVLFVRWSRVVKGQDIIGFEHHVDLVPTREDLIAIEVGHRFPKLSDVRS